MLHPHDPVAVVSGCHCCLAVKKDLGVSPPSRHADGWKNASMIDCQSLCVNHALLCVDLEAFYLSLPAERRQTTGSPVGLGAQRVPGWIWHQDGLIFKLQGAEDAPPWRSPCSLNYASQVAFFSFLYRADCIFSLTSWPYALVFNKAASRQWVALTTEPELLPSGQRSRCLLSERIGLRPHLLHLLL